MQRGNLVIYDITGKIVFQTGEAEGNIFPHEYPVGIPYIEIPFGTMSQKRVISIDVSDPKKHKPIFENIPYTPTYEDLENELLIYKGVI